MPDYNPGSGGAPGDNPYSPYEPYPILPNSESTVPTGPTNPPSGYNPGGGGGPGDNPFNPNEPIPVLPYGVLTSIATPATIQDIIVDLGAAWTALQSVLSTSLSSTTMSEMIMVRQIIDGAISDTVDYVPGNQLASSVHQVITSLPGILNGSITPAAVALNTYFMQQYNQTFQVYWGVHGGITWTSAFIAFWRNAMGEEIIVELGALAQNTSGEWNYTTSQTILLDSPFEVVVVSGCAAGAVLTVGVTHANPSVPYSSVEITIPANTPANTVIPFGSDTNNLTAFNGITSMSATGGETGDIFQVWVAGGN